MTTLHNRLGYRFRNPALLEQALCHRSAGKPHNERLEFLGDAVLGFIVSDLLYHRFPNAPEGDLSRIRSRLVQRSTLAAVARQLHLGEALKLGLGELKSGGAQRESILADAMEALVCALYLDAGLAVCSEKLQQWLAPLLDESVHDDAVTKDAKTRLQEWLQGHRQPLPVYTVTAKSGSDHAQQFTVTCEVALLATPGVGNGSSRKEAEQQAATQVLLHLEARHD